MLTHLIKRQFRNALRQLTQVRKPRRATCRVGRLQPQESAEQLEQRTLLTANPVIQVNVGWDGADLTGAGDGRVDAHPMSGDQITLRAAVQEANARPGHDVIQLPSGNFNLSLKDWRNGDIDIRDDVTIRGAGSDRTTINANAINRVFDVMAGVDATIEGLTLKNGKAKTGQNGGAIQNAGQLAVRDVTFENNTAYSGGAIRNSAVGELRVFDSVFMENTSQAGGGIRTEGPVQIESSSFWENHGGAIFARNHLGDQIPLTVSASDFDGNVASGSSYKGSIYVGKGFVAQLLDSTITRNVDGAVFNEARLDIAGSDISDNTATWTGGITNMGELHVSDSTLIGNSGVRGAGAISNSATGVLHVHGSTFEDNTSHWSFGGISTFGDLDVSNSHFIHNGGAIRVLYRTGNPALINIADTNFRDNSAASGAALNNWGGIASLHNVEMTENTSTHSGGAIANSGELVITLGYFADNSADSGGAIANHMVGDLTIRESHLTENNARHGGAISNTGNVTLVSTTINLNDATRGGGVHHRLGALHLSDVQLQENEATTGGAIFSQSGELQLHGGAVSKNTAEDLGGGIYTASTTEITGTPFIHNHATQGGAMFVESGSAVLTDTYIADNTALNGAGLYNKGSVRVLGSTIDDNHATWAGGGVINDGGSLWLQDSDLRRNRAFVGAGICNVRAAKTVVVNADLLQNSAYAGGGIYNHGSSVWLMLGTTVRDNSAKAGRNLCQISGRTTLFEASVGDQVFSNAVRDGRWLT